MSTRGATRTTGRERGAAQNGQAIHLYNTEGKPLRDVPPQVVEAGRQMLGRTLTVDDVTGLVGAQPGDHVGVSAVRLDYGGSVGRDWIININFTGANGSYGQPGGYRATRSLQRDGDGRTFIANTKFYVDATAQGRGIGSSVLAKQAATAQRLGVAYMATNPMNERAEATWRKLGYRRWTNPDGEDMLRFDVEPGSQSWATLNAYRAARAARGV